jgi:hypothetical protein
VKSQELLNRITVNPTKIQISAHHSGTKPPEQIVAHFNGEYSQRQLEALLIASFDKLIAELTENRFVELTLEYIIVHA